jgi:hypothetical protein
VSTYLDGASPSVSPDPDGGTDVESPSALESGPQWVQAEIQRRIAENRSRRSRHARVDDAAAPVDALPDQSSSGAEESSAERPEDHAPRHGVPSAVVATPSADVGPSVSRAGLPVRRRRSGRRKPPPVDGPPAAELWSRPPWGTPVAATPLAAPVPVDVPANDASADVATAEPAAPTEPAATAGPAAEPAVAPEPVVAAEPAPIPEPAAPPPAAVAESVVTEEPATVPEPATTAAPATTAKPSPAETTDEIVDPPTAPHPVVLGDRAAAARRVAVGPRVRRLDQRRLTAPRPATPRSMPVVGLEPEPGSNRVRVVLSERKGVARPVRTIKEVQENTAVGDLLRRNLIRTQLSVTLRFAALTAAVLVALPVMFAALPELGRLTVLGLRVPWLLLGVLIYPFLIGVAWRYTRAADRIEQNFADHVQD